MSCFPSFLLNYTNLVYNSYRFRTKYNCNSKRYQASSSYSIDYSYNVTIIKLPTEGLGTLISYLNNNKLYYSTKSSYDSQRDFPREARYFLFSNKMSLRKPTTVLKTVPNHLHPYIIESRF